MSISKKEFLSMLATGNVETSVVKAGKADWDAIFKELKQVQAPLDISTIQKYYVKDVVSRYRTLNKMDEWWRAKKCLRLVGKNRKYVYFFRIPKGYDWPEESPSED